MLKTSLEFAANTHESVKKLAKSVPAFDLLTAYRNAVNAFNTTDIVLLIATHDDEVIAFEAKPRATYIAEAMNEAAAKLHPVGKQSAHEKMMLPASSPAFWVVFELRDKDTIVPCAIGAVQYEMAASESAGLSPLLS